MSTEWEDKPKTGGKIFLKDTSDKKKKSLHKVYKEHLKLDNKEMKQLEKVLMTLIDASPKEVYIWQIIWEEECVKCHHMLSETCKLKQWDRTACRQNVQGQNTDDSKGGENVEHQELLDLTDRMQNGAATLDSGLAVPYETKHTLTIRPSNMPLRQRSWYLGQQENLHLDVYTDLFIIARTWKHPHVFDRSMNK